MRNCRQQAFDEFYALMLFMLIMILLAGPGLFFLDHVSSGWRSSHALPLPEPIKS